ncbi:hypothetical protein FE784_01675 [Paenibacillus hemerocallicola]|uniref:DUF4838 domain-containing protein n=1 Tax=Paenibacillus hemerocallicola TaxID=1172614 RepID=A0A5C4TGH0_9BACL|nr:hypothetical protein [Paenibacillus hemerocallicola]TNJ67882.1 hypothetical protein FE784_01675 [Paenibacillus hemerocallicola]
MDGLVELECRCLCPEAKEAARIAAERIGEISGSGAPIPFRLTFVERETEGYVLEIPASREAVIGAKRRRDFIAGLGQLLHRLLAAADPGCSGAKAVGVEVEDDGGQAASVNGGLSLQAGVWETVPSIKDRIHYMPGHFGNSFEVCWSGEMRRYLEDMALSGASGYGDWFDPNDMPDPYNPHVYHSTSMFLWRRKKEWLSYSQQLGLDNVLVVTPNVGYVDQMRPEWVGVRNHQLRVQGQVLCPSNPQAREVILDNQKRLFEDLMRSGILISKIVCAPYDDGGCACPACQPYYPVFLQLVKDVHDTVSVFYPGLKADICGWWTSEEESGQLLEFVNGPARAWFGSFQFSASYGVFELPEDIRVRTGGMNLGCFLHIGFSHDRRDVYTKTGVHSASRRIRSVLKSFGRSECAGFMTYNESFGDHFNAFAAGLLGWNPDRDVGEIAEFYGRLMFRLSGSALRKLADVLLEMEMLDGKRAADWSDTLRGIKREVRTHESQEWAFEQIWLKAELMRLDERIEQQLTENKDAAYPAMRERLSLTERLWRRVYGFGVLRHILIPERMLPDWHNVYCDLERTGNVGGIRSGVMAEDA